jgi:hypothetical protein
VPNSLDRCVPSQFGTDPTINLTMNTMEDAVADPVVAPFGQTHTNYSFTMQSDRLQERRKKEKLYHNVRSRDCHVQQQLFILERADIIDDQQLILQALQRRISPVTGTRE